MVVASLRNMTNTVAEEDKPLHKTCASDASGGDAHCALKEANVTEAPQRPVDLVSLPRRADTDTPLQEVRFLWGRYNTSLVSLCTVSLEEPQEIVADGAVQCSRLSIPDGFAVKDMALREENGTAMMVGEANRTSSLVALRFEDGQNLTRACACVCA